MAGDFLHQPLGQDRDQAKAPPRRGRRVTLSAALLAAMVAVLAVAWRMTPSATDRPAGVVASITPAKPPPPAPPPPAAPSPTAAPADSDTTGGIKVVRPPGSSATVGQFIEVPQDTTVGLAPAPDPRLVEPSRFGPLPRRALDGTRPAEVYARPTTTDPGVPPNAPRLALMVGGMGLNAALTTSAANDLPPAVTLGFAPYGDNLDGQVQAARAAGHEVVLQLPMEGYGDPASASMSHLLATGLDGKELIERLHWLMSRFTGYAGVSNFLGGKFTGDETALQPVLRDIASRGLFFVDDGSSPRSLVPALAGSVNLPVARATVLLDDMNAAAAESALDRLRQRANEHGCTIGIAAGLPAMVPKIAAFARSLAAKGVALVPVSACVGAVGTIGASAQP